MVFLLLNLVCWDEVYLVFHRFVEVFISNFLFVLLFQTITFLTEFLIYVAGFLVQILK